MLIQRQSSAHWGKITAGRRPGIDSRFKSKVYSRGFYRGRKTCRPGQKTSEVGREQKKDYTHKWLLAQDVPERATRNRRQNDRPHCRLFEMLAYDNNLRNSIRTSAAKAEHYHPSFALPSLSEYVLNNELRFTLVVTSLTILISSAFDAVKRTCSLHCIGENPKFVLNVLV